MRKTVWVTGSTGFSGWFMIQHLRSVKPPVRIVGLDIRPDSNRSADAFLAVDLSDRDALRRAIEAEPPDFVIHLAGLMPPQPEQMMMQVNVNASVALAESFAEFKSATIRIVSVGSAAEYGSNSEHPNEQSNCIPTSPYGRSKLEQTSRMLSFDSPSLEVIVARPFNLIGPGLSENLVAGGLCRQFADLGESGGRIVPKGPIGSIRDFVDIRDVVSAYWTLATSGKPGEIYNICTGKGTSVARLIEIMMLEFDTKVDVKPDYDKLTVFADVSIGQNKKLESLGWRPEFTIEESVAAMVESARTE